MGRLVFPDANLLDGEHAARPGSTVVVEGDRIASAIRPTTTSARHPRRP
jgi:hypothetical protein